jgi:hypothetical protein
VLAAGLVWANWFWSQQVTKLVDRLMSRDFPTYQAAHLAEMREKAAAKEKVFRVPLNQDAEDLTPASELAPPF